MGTGRGFIHTRGAFVCRPSNRHGDQDFSEVDRLKSAYQAAGLEVRMSKTGIELVPSADHCRIDGS